MHEIELSTGTVDYADEGDGPPVVLLHGVMMNHRQWDTVLPLLPPGFRYLRPVLPLGSHRHPTRPGADLTHEGLARLTAELLEALDLSEVTLVVTDWGGPLLMPGLGIAGRVSRLVVFPCEAFDNFPIGLPGRVAVLASWLPGALILGARQLRVPWLRRTPLLMGQMAAHPLPDDLVDDWTASLLRDPRIRADLQRFGRQRLDRPRLVALTEGLADFPGRMRIVWSPDAKPTPPEHAARLLGLAEHGDLVEIPGAYVLSMLDDPSAAANAIRAVLLEPVSRPSRPRAAVAPGDSAAPPR